MNLKKINRVDFQWDLISLYIIKQQSVFRFKINHSFKARVSMALQAKSSRVTLSGSWCYQIIK